MKRKKNAATELPDYSSLVSSPHPDYGGKNLKALRKALGMTQTELANRAGVSQSLITAVERDVEQKGTDVTRARIANVLVLAEHQRIIEMGATPKTDTEKLRERIALLERDLEIERNDNKTLEAENEEWKKRYDVALELLNAKQKKIVSKADYDAKLEAAGLEELPTVEEEALRAEIEQRGKKGK